MADFADLRRLINGPFYQKPLPAIWNFLPSPVSAVGGVPSFLKYYFDVEEKMRLQLKLKEALPEALIIPGVFPDLGVVVEASAFGGQISWFEDGAPFISPMIRNTSDIDSLKAPRAGFTGLMPLVLAQREVMRRKLEEGGQRVEQWAFSMGPAEISGLLLGYEKFYFALYDDFGRLRKLMDLVTDFVLEWIRIQEKTCGDISVMAIADHVMSQVSPQLAREMIFPFLKSIFSTFPKAARIYHNEGFHSDEHIKLVLALGADIWHFGSDVHDLSDLYSKVGDQVVLFGGLDPHGVISAGSPEEVWEETRRVVRKAEGHRLVLSTGTGTTPETTLENQRAMVRAALVA